MLKNYLKIAVRALLGAGRHRLERGAASHSRLPPTRVLGLVLAVPVAYVGMNSWLDNFAYRIELGPFVFLMVDGVVLAIAVITVSHQAIKAAITDPARTLRYE